MTDDLREKVARAIHKALLADWLAAAEAKTVDSPEGHCHRAADKATDAALAVVDTGLAEKVQKLAARWKTSPNDEWVAAGEDLEDLLREHEQADDQ